MRSVILKLFLNNELWGLWLGVTIDTCFLSVYRMVVRKLTTVVGLEDGVFNYDELVVV